MKYQAFFSLKIQKEIKMASAAGVNRTLMALAVFWHNHNGAICE